MKKVLRNVLFAVMGVFFVGFVGLIAASMWSERRLEATTGWIFVDPAGRPLDAGPFDEVTPFLDGAAAVRVGDLWGFVGADGRWLIEPRFADVGPFTPGAPAPALDGESLTWGYVDRAGEWAIPPQWHRASPFAEGRAVVGRAVGRSSTRVSGSMGNTIYHFGLVDLAGELVVDPAPEKAPDAWTTAWGFSDGLAAVQVGGDRFGYVDAGGAFVIEPRFDAASGFSEGFAEVSEGGRWGLIRKDGTPLVEPRFGLTRPFTEGRAAVRAAEGWAYVDAEGLLPLGEQRFEGARRYSEGLAAVEIDGAWGFIDTAGAVVVEPAFVDVDPAGFRDGRAAVAVPDGAHYAWGFITREGTPAWETSYREVMSFTEGLAAVRVEDDPPG